MKRINWEKASERKVEGKETKKTARELGIGSKIRSDGSTKIHG